MTMVTPPSTAIPSTSSSRSGRARNVGKAYIKLKSNGGGSNGSGDDDGDGGDDDSGSTGKVKNPWKKEHFNMTQQGVLLRTNAKLAEKFKREAGVLK
jgi:hypothetical protein